MKLIKFLCLGIAFGIILVKSEAVSWYRIFEMFKFQSFHMYGIIGSAIATGTIGIHFLKRRAKKAGKGPLPNLRPKEKSIARYLIGGSIFGLGWALAGACPGPMFILVGTGLFSMLIVIVAAMLGTFLYGLLRHRLPH